jgi:hypothetical protein
MASSQVRVPDGSVITVEHEAGATPEAIKALARQRHAAPPPRPEPSVSAAPSDVVGRAKEFLTREPPAGARTGVSRALFGERIGSVDVPGRVVRAAGDLVLPGNVPEAARTAATLPIGGGLLTGPLMRTGAGALAGAAASAAQGKEGWGVGGEGARQGASQLAGEILPGLLRFGLTQRAARPLLAASAARSKHDTAMHEAVTTLEERGYKADVAARRTTDAAALAEARAQHQANAQRIKQQHEAIETTRTRQYKSAEDAKAARHAADVEAATATHTTQVRGYQEQGAASIADAFKKQVPAWEGFASTERGLLGMVYGKGQRLLSQRFDEALRDVVRGATGRPIKVRASDAGALGIGTVGSVDAAEGQIAHVFVDAAVAAQAVTGRWRRDPGLYRRVVGALDEAGIGDPAARAEYKAGQALIQFADRTQMLKGERFNPEAARAGFTKLKVVDELRRRGEGDIFEGPIAAAVRRPAPELRLPAEPAAGRPPRPLAAPLIPPFRRPRPSPEIAPPMVRIAPGVPALPEGVKTRKLPNLGFWEGAALAEIPFLVAGLATGQHHLTGYGMPAAAGGLLARGLRNRTIATEAPLSPLSSFATRVLPQVGAQQTSRALEATR